MNEKTAGRRGSWTAAALAAVTAVAVLSACRGIPAPTTSSAVTGSASYRAQLAYAHCMQSHGLPNFPNPKPGPGPGPGPGPEPSSAQHRGVSVQLNGRANSPAARANDACKHLLAGGRRGTGDATAPATASASGAVPTD
jgi:hypothetical protein